MTTHSNSPEYSWERQPGEGTPAYQAFCLYRDLPHRNPPEKRCIRAVCEILHKSRITLGDWSVKWNWVERCRDYDNELQKEELEVRKAAIREMQDAHISVAKALQKKALKALAELPQETMTARNILDYLIQGIELERRAKIEQAEAVSPATAFSKGSKTGFLAEMDEPEESTMMQLVKSLETARKEKEQRKEK
jgi:hypothetical protein